jgi:hypothetical protein
MCAFFGNQDYNDDFQHIPSNNLDQFDTLYSKDANSEETNAHANVYSLRKRRLKSSTVLYASAPCGSGKTHQLCLRAKRLAEAGRVVFYAAPTKILIDQIARDLVTKHGVPPENLRVFYKDSEDARGYKTVAGALVQFLLNRSDEEDDKGYVILTTHAQFQHIPFIPNKSSMHLLFDEAPKVEQCTPCRLPITHPILTDHIELIPFNSIYSEITKSEGLKVLASNPEEDEVLKFLGERLRILVSPHYRSFVHTETYNRFLKGEISYFDVHSVLEPSVLDEETGELVGVLDGWASVLIASANFEDTFAHRIWTRAGINFVEDATFKNSLRYIQHDNGHLLTIVKCVPDRNWSKKVASQTLEDGTTFLDRFLNYTTGQIPPEEQVLWSVNKSSLDQIIKPKNVTIPPPNPHGLNEYTDRNHVVLAAAYNPPPAHFRFLNSFVGLTGEEVKNAVAHEHFYQIVSRCSLRDPLNTSRKFVYTTDDASAAYIASKFPGSTIETGDLELPEPKETGRPRKWASDKERKATYRKAQAEKRVRVIEEQNELNRLALRNAILADPQTPSEGFPKTPPTDIRRAYGTLYPRMKSNQLSGYFEFEDNTAFLELIGMHHSETVIEDKEKICAFSPAIFDGIPNFTGVPEGENPTLRGKANILCLRGFALDIEKGDLRPEEFPDIFPDLQLFTVNTYRHRDTAPRYRVFILSDRPHTIGAHEEIMEQIKNKIYDAGYETKTTLEDDWKPSAGKKRSGIDWGKRDATSLFLLPAQAKDPSQSFFEVYIDEGRKPLNVMTWLENGRFQLNSAETSELFPAPLPVVPTSQDGKPTEEWLRIKEERCTAAESKFLGVSEGNGHNEFYLLRNAYLNAGCDLFETKSRLTAMANRSRSPKERKAEIRDLMKTAALYKPRNTFAFDPEKKKKRWVPDHEAEPEIDPKLFKSMRRSELSFVRAAAGQRKH